MISRPCWLLDAKPDPDDYDIGFGLDDPEALWYLGDRFDWLMYQAFINAAEEPRLWA